MYTPSVSLSVFSHTEENLGVRMPQNPMLESLLIGSTGVPFCGSYSYKVIPKRNYYGA